MVDKGCDNCYYTYFDEKAYPCSLCIRGIERTDQWQPSKKTKADIPQTETKGVRYCNECKWFRNKQVCGRCRSKNLFAEADTPQTDLSAEEFVEGMKNLKMEVKQTDCPWK